MEKRTVVLVIGGLFFLALTFILMAIFVSEHKMKQRQFLLPKYLNSSTCPPDFAPLPIILVSLDGFRPDYMTLIETPVIYNLIKNGVSAPYMATTYPSLTFPNHYSIVTGLYSESHGILSNTFMERESGRRFSSRTNISREKHWWGGEPIWNTVVKNGYKSATYFWPGSETPIGGLKPTYYKNYSKSVALNDRVDQVLEWLKLPADERPIFLSLYSNQPDSAGHKYGPMSDKIHENLNDVDEMIRRLIVGLKTQNILHCVNLIFTSDHGMTTGGEGKSIDLAPNLGHLSQKVNFESGSTAGLSLKKAYRDEEPELQHSLTCKNKKIRVFKKEEVPLRLHFTNNKNIHDYIMIAEEGYNIAINDSFFINGLHGYDSHVKSMNALFFAYGPSFKAGVQTEPFQNIEIYNLMCHLLGLIPAPNNGTGGRLDDILKTPPTAKQITKDDEYPNMTDVTPERYSISACEGDVEYDTELLEMLNLEEDSINNITQRILPWGTPQLNQFALNIGLLYHPTHVTAYSKTLKMPLWTGFIIDSLPSSKQISALKWRSDIRLYTTEAPSCPELENMISTLSTDFTLSAMYPAEFSKTESLSSLVTNALPFSNVSLIHWEQFLLDTVPGRLKYSNSSIHVTVGPIFDANSDGIADYRRSNVDTALPSDFFAVITRCQQIVTDLNECQDQDLDAIGFVFPQIITINNCLSAEEFALDYSVKIHDVEIITGLRFFTKIPNEQRLKIILREHQILWPLSKQ